MVSSVKQVILRAIRSTGYELRHNPYHRGRGPSSTRGRKPKSAFIDVLPIRDISHPAVALDELVNPLPAIMQSAEFPETVGFFAHNPAASRSLVSPDTQALLYTLIRNLRAEWVVEIGSFRCGTAEAMCRALHANGTGRLLTVDPFGGRTVPDILAWWPDELQHHVRYMHMNSADFYIEIEKQGLRPDLVFVDGNHDYEFALFDIQCAARRIARGGFICIDNISQPGPFFAAVDFLKANPDWTECGTSSGRYDVSKAFDRERTSIHNTDMTVLRAPATWSVEARPRTSGELSWASNIVRGIRLSPAPGNHAGVLHVQCVMRGFGTAGQVEITGQATLALDGQSPTVSAEFEPPIALEGDFARFGVEPWLIWEGETPLRLVAEPSIY
jgi:predicted O-methyltransferase YrrM